MFGSPNNLASAFTVLGDKAEVRYALRRLQSEKHAKFNRESGAVTAAYSASQLLLNGAAALEREQFQIALGADPEAQMRLACSRNVRPCVLAKLARSVDWRIRALVAANLNTPHPVLEVLAKDKDEDVRAWVAGNTETPDLILLKLVQDRSHLVRLRAAGNSTLPAIGLTSLVFDFEPAVRLAIAVNPSMSKMLISILVTDPNASVRSRVARNPNVSATQLLKLSEDSDRGVRLSANARLHQFFNVLRSEQLLSASKHDLPIVIANDEYSKHSHGQAS